MWSRSPLEEKCLPAVPVAIKKANLKPLGSMNSENPLFSKCGSMSIDYARSPLLMRHLLS